MTKKVLAQVSAPAEDMSAEDFDAFLAWNESQIDGEANEELDARIAEVRKAAEESPHRPANALKDEAANMIWEAMEARGWTQAELARQLGKSRAYVSKLLSGGENLTLETLAQLGEVLGCEWNLSLRPKRPMIVAPLPVPATIAMPSLPLHVARSAFRPRPLRLVTDNDLLADAAPLPLEA